MDTLDPMQRPHPLQAANPPVTHVYLRKNGSSFAALKAENSSLLREDIARGAVRYRGLPEVLTLNHTDLCNLRCVMCPRHLAQGVHRLSRRVLSYLCDELLPTAHKLVLTTSGGEPLAADFDFLLERALRYAVKLDVVTNGVLLTPELYRHARGALDHLNVSLDCHIPEVYHRIRLGADFARVESHLMAIRDARAREKDGVLFSVSAVVMRSNLPHLADFVRYAKRAGADAVVLQRLRHETKPTPEEEPTSYFTAAQIQESFALACAVAREESMNLFMSEFGLPGVMAEPLRSKIPPSLEGHGLCWFLAQDFGVMYTGEVYPCCIPTDHCLGNVLFEDPVAIWNGAPMVALRAAHLSKRGTTFCSGCLHAPHLAPRRPAALNAAARRVRVAFGHVRRTLARKLQARLAPPIFDPPLPAVVARDGRFAEAAGAARVIDRAPANEVLTRQRHDGSVWWIHDGALYRAPTLEQRGACIARLKPSPAPRSTALQFISPAAALVGFEEDGKLLRVELDLEPRVREVLAFADRRSFVRQGALVVAADEVLVGEYGVFPSARCANLHRSRDGGRTFRLSERFRGKHIHLVGWLASGAVVVTTGDLPAERCGYVSRRSGGRFVKRFKSWSGFTAFAETEHFIHFGTDLDRGNGLVRADRALAGVPEFRAFPAPLDLQVREILDLGALGLLALCGMDADLGEQRAGRRAVLLLSRDEGTSWSVVHRFAADWSDAPEGLVPLGGARLVTVCTEQALVLELPP